MYMSISSRKKSKKSPLTPGDKRRTRRLARVRVRVEHAIAGIKICRIAKDQFRNMTEGLSDRVMQIACGLHNLRVNRRARRHKNSDAYFR